MIADLRPCETCPCPAGGPPCPAVALPHPTLCGLAARDPAWRAEVLRLSGAGPGAPSLSPADDGLASVASRAMNCPHRRLIDGRGSCCDDRICDPDDGRRPGQKVGLAICVECVREFDVAAPDPPPAGPPERPASVPGPDGNSRPRLKGIRCPSCPVRKGVSCAGETLFDFCENDRDYIVRLTPWQHSLFLCKDRIPPRRRPPQRPGRDGRLRVGLFGPVLQGGGAEEWQRMLVRTLDRTRIAVVGLGAMEATRVSKFVQAEMAELLPISVGDRACRDLSADCDLALCWGIDRLERIMPLVDRWPTVVMVSHTDTAFGWDIMVHKQHQIDAYAAVSKAALVAIPASRRRQTTVIPNAVDPDRCRPTHSAREERKLLGIPEGVPILGYIGRPDGNQKRPKVVAEALAYLPRWHALFVGEHWGDKSVWDECRRIAGDRAHFAGQRRDVGNVMQVMTRLAVPSAWESFCLVAGEAMVHGLPVLMTPFGVALEHPSWVASLPSQVDGRTLAAAVLADCERDVSSRIREAREGILEHHSPAAFGSRWSDWLCSLARPSPVLAGPT